MEPPFSQLESLVQHLANALLPYLDKPLAFFGHSPITAFGGLQDPKASCDELGAWREQTNASLLLQMFPGDHFFLHSAESLLLESLSQKLHQIVRDTGS